MMGKYLSSSSMSLLESISEPIMVRKAGKVALIKEKNSRRARPLSSAPVIGIESECCLSGIPADEFMIPSLQQLNCLICIKIATELSSKPARRRCRLEWWLTPSQRVIRVSSTTNNSSRDEFSNPPGLRWLIRLWRAPCRGVLARDRG